MYVSWIFRMVWPKVFGIFKKTCCSFREIKEMLWTCDNSLKAQFLPSFSRLTLSRFLGSARTEYPSLEWESCMDTLIQIWAICLCQATFSSDTVIKTRNRYRLNRRISLSYSNAIIAPKLHVYQYQIERNNHAFYFAFLKYNPPHLCALCIKNIKLFD